MDKGLLMKLVKNAEKERENVEKLRLKKIEENRKNIPPMDNLPDGHIDWEEISSFILEDMASSHTAGLVWNWLNDCDKTAKLAPNSLTVLKSIEYDMFGFFYRHDVEAKRYDHWRVMENYVRTKYKDLSENALSKLITSYHIADK